MQPGSAFHRPARMPRRTVPALLLGMAAALFLALPAQVAACDCALIDPAQAALDSDVVFVGTLVGQGGAAQPIPMPAGTVETAWTWNVELSRSPDDPTTITVMAPQSDGANCGVSFGIEERWLVMADSIEGVLRTSGCSSNTPADGAQGAYAEVIDALVPIGSGANPESGLALPMPTIVLVGGAALLVVVSVFAFRERVR